MFGPPESPSGSNREVEPKTRWVPSSERALATYPLGVSPGGFSVPRIPWTRAPFGIRTGMPLEPSEKHGSQIVGPPKAKVLSAELESASGEPKGFGFGGGKPELMPT